MRSGPARSSERAPGGLDMHPLDHLILEPLGASAEGLD